MRFIKQESSKDIKEAVFSKTIEAGDGIFQLIKKGQTFRITDICGQQGVDVYFMDADNTQDHYSAVKTIVAQKNLYITTGTVLMSESGKEMSKITATTCPEHDTLGGACSSQSNTVRYAHSKEYMHNCRDTFLYEISKDKRYSKRDIAANINILTSVPFTPEGKTFFNISPSFKGAYIEMEALRDIMLLISNCPQINNPCAGFNPTEISLDIF
jgi:urea carboxylase-associated protein 1